MVAEQGGSLETAQLQTQRKASRPTLVWIISIFYLFSAGYTLLSFALIYSGKIPLDATTRNYFDSLTVVDHLFTVLLGLGNLSGAISLFFMRKVAYTLFLASFITSFFLTVYQSFAKGFWAALGSIGSVGFLIGTGIGIGIILYSRDLVKKGVLR